MLLSPPGSRLRVGKIGKDADTWPDSILVVISLRGLTIQISLSSFDEDWIILIDLHTRIHNAHYVEPHLLKLGKQSYRIRETDVVPGEDPVAVQAINVEIKGIAGNVPLTIAARDRPNFISLLITEPTLPIPQPPNLSNRHMPP